MTLMCPAAIIIGFENTTFTVDESVGMFDVYVSVSSPPLDLQLIASIDLVIQTIDGNASKDNNFLIGHCNNNFSFFSWRS